MTYVQLPPDSGGKKVRTFVIGDEHVQVVALVDADGVPVTVDGDGNLTVSLTAATLAALETIGLDAATLAALETVELGATTINSLNADARTLTERMFAKAPASGYSLYLDTADATYIYLAEAPTTSATTATVFRGIRVTKDASGNPLGGVATATGFAWDSRSSASWAA